jgi:hypothetical protein
VRIINTENELENAIRNLNKIILIKENINIPIIKSENNP